jgi:hypothetical protein
MTPVGSGAPGGVTGPGCGVGPLGSPVRVVDEPHPASANRTSAAAMCFTVCPAYLSVVTLVFCVIVTGSGCGANDPEILSEEWCCQLPPR